MGYGLFLSLISFFSQCWQSALFQSFFYSTFCLCQDSAAISGGEDRELERDASPRRDASHPSAVPTRHAVHPLNSDSGGSTAAGPVDVGAASDAGVTQREFLRSLVADAMEDFRDDVHRDIQGLHVAMLRQFHNFEVR